MLKKFFIFLSLAFLNACGDSTQEKQQVRVSFQLPLMTEKQEVKNFKLGSVVAAGLADINCVGLLLGRASGSLGSCKKKNSGSLFSVSAIFGLQKVGAGSASFDLGEYAVGESLNFTVVGFKINNLVGNCPVINDPNFEPDTANVSPPYIVAEGAMTVLPGEQLTTLQGAFAQSHQVEDCDSSIFKDTSSSSNPTWPGVSGRVVHLDAGDSGNFNFDVGGKIVTWLSEVNGDLFNSAAINDASRPSWISNSVGGKGSVNFVTASQNYFTLTTQPSTSQTIFVVFSYVSPGGALLSSSDSSLFRSAEVYLYDGHKLGIIMGNPTTSAEAMQFTGLVTNQTYMLAIKNSVTSFTAKMFPSGTQYSANIGQLPSNAFSVGANNSTSGFLNFLSGQIGELIIFNNVLSASEMLEVENYLKAKWGL